jgi:ligand-binding SRPBCC domain-containing protein
MIFTNRFEVDAPLSAVVDFHRRSASMGAITPPPIIARIEAAPEILGEGDEMAFTLWMGPLPLRWLARIEDVSPAGFRDRQLRGPFAFWLHTHRFDQLPDGRTAVFDQVEAQLRRHLLWGPVGAMMWLGMPLLFAYRGWRTRGLLKQPAG